VIKSYVVQKWYIMLYHGAVLSIFIGILIAPIAAAYTSTIVQIIYLGEISVLGTLRYHNRPPQLCTSLKTIIS